MDIEIEDANSRTSPTRQDKSDTEIEALRKLIASKEAEVGIFPDESAALKAEAERLSARKDGKADVVVEKRVPERESSFWPEVEDDLLWGLERPFAEPPHLPYRGIPSQEREIEEDLLSENSEQIQAGEIDVSEAEKGVSSDVGDRKMGDEEDMWYSATEEEPVQEEQDAKKPGSKKRARHHGPAEGERPHKRLEEFLCILR